VIPLRVTRPDSPSRLVTFLLVVHENRSNRFRQKPASKEKSAENQVQFSKKKGRLFSLEPTQIRIRQGVIRKCAKRDGRVELKNREPPSDGNRLDQIAHLHACTKSPQSQPTN
jgi:hypothetical protein